MSFFQVNPDDRNAVQVQVSSARPNPDGYKDEHCRPSEHRREDDWESTRKRKVTGSKIVKNNSFVIPTHNRFSYWDEDESNEPVVFMKEEIKTDKIKVITQSLLSKVIKENKKEHKFLKSHILV